MFYSKGDLVIVKTPEKSHKLDLCMIVSTTIPTIYGMGDFFMVYSIRNKEKFITTKNHMKRVDKSRGVVIL